MATEASISMQRNSGMPMAADQQASEIPRQIELQAELREALSDLTRSVSVGLAGDDAETVNQAAFEIGFDIGRLRSDVEAKRFRAALILCVALRHKLMAVRGDRWPSLSCSPGCSDSFAMVRLGRSDAWVLCGPDGASIRVSLRLKPRDRLVSLERLLGDVGFRTVMLKANHTQKWLDAKIAELWALERRP